MKEYQDIKTFLQKVMFWSEEVFVITKVENTVSLTYVIGDLKGEEIVGTFYKKELQNTNQKEFRTEKVIKTLQELQDAKNILFLTSNVSLDFYTHIDTYFYSNFDSS